MNKEMRLMWICPLCGKVIRRKAPSMIGIDAGFHTFSHLDSHGYIAVSKEVQNLVELLEEFEREVGNNE